MARRKQTKRVDPLEALATLNRALSGTLDMVEARRRILDRYARKLPNGRPMLCTPPRTELLAGSVPGAFKVIFDCEQDAWDAARELCALGAPPMTPYTCPRSRRGHQHLKTIKQYRSEKGV